MEVDTEKCSEMKADGQLRQPERHAGKKLNEFGFLSDCTPLELCGKRALFGLQALAQQSQLTFEYVDGQIESSANIRKRVIADE